MYLDVWEREVTVQEDPNLVHPLIGIGTCVRLKREWVVRVRPSELAPASGDNDYQADHSYYALARLTRRTGVTAILPEHLADLRRAGLIMLSAHHIQQLTTDAFGPSYTLDGDGQPNLKVSLRNAINAMLRGEVPSTPDLRLTTDPKDDYSPVAITLGDEVWLFWVSTRSGYDIWCKCYSQVTGTWSQDTPLTTDPAADAGPFALTVGDEVWLFWMSTRSGNTDIWHKILYPVI